jgi:methyltransferase (TIGR00027 family)
MSGPKPSRTARGVAAERALLTELGVLDDPYALGMLGRPMTLAHHLVRRRPQVVPTLPVVLAGLGARVLWHDERVRAALDAGVRQVAVVGAGYDSRPWRLRRDGVRFFELDDTTTQQDKREKARRIPGPGPTYVEADLRDRTAADALVREGLEPAQPAVHVFEGLTMYLTEEVLRRQLAALAEVSASGSRLTTDFLPPRHTGSDAERRKRRVQRLARMGSGETLRLGLHRTQAVALVEACGWRVDEAVAARAAAQALVPAAPGLPVDAVSEHGTFLAASRQRPSAAPGPPGAQGAAGAAGAPPAHEDGPGRVDDRFHARGGQQDVGAVAGAVHGEHGAIVDAPGRGDEWQLRP